MRAGTITFSLNYFRAALRYGRNTAKSFAATDVCLKMGELILYKIQNLIEKHFKITSYLLKIAPVPAGVAISHLAF